MRPVGRPSLGYTAELRGFGLPVPMMQALDSLAETSGLSRASLVRTIIAEHLQNLGLLSEQELTPTIPSNPTKKES